MNRRLAVAALAAGAAACVHQPASPRPATAAVPTVWERQIRNAKDAGDGDYSLRQLREKVAAQPGSVAPRLELARAYRERGYRDVALEICRLAAERFPDSAEAHSWMGILLDESGQREQAETAYRRAIALAPAADHPHNNLGYNLLEQRRFGEAAAEFRVALQLNPASQVARNNLGLALAHQESAGEAVAEWQQGADAATAHNNLAAVWIEKGNYPAARKELEIALGYNRTFPAALKNLELLSRLDGSPLRVPQKPEPTRWARWKTGFKKLWVGPLDEPRKAPAKTAASVAGTGEQQ
jgi:tetratricopeptide (TPR) repeat protein